MKSKSLTNNFFMYILRMVSGILFTLIIFPYISRVLGPLGIGKIQYVESILAYFILFINIGIPIYGTREIAAIREKKRELSKLTSELLIILSLNTILGIIVYLGMLNTVPIMKENKGLFLIFGIQIIFNFMDLDWFYRGVEDQTYITIRSIIFKILSFVPIYLLIKTKEDYRIYALILVVSLVGSNIFNFIRIFKYIKFSEINFKELKIVKHLKPLLIFFLSNVALSLFYSLDSIMLGSIAGEEALGFYTLASKIGRMPILFISAITGVISPRLCNYIRKNDKENYYKLASKGLDYLLLFCIPATVGLYLIAPEVIEILGGKKFIPSIGILKIYSMLLLVLGIAYFSGSLVFTPNNMEKYSFYSLIIAGIFNIIFNLIFIPMYNAYGAVLGTILSEALALTIRIYLGKKIFNNFKFINLEKIKIIIATFIMGITIYGLKSNIENIKLNLLLKTVIGSFSYLISLLILKEKNIIEIYIKLNNKILKKRKLI